MNGEQRLALVAAAERLEGEAKRLREMAGELPAIHAGTKKLSAEQVCAIRASQESSTELARRHGVSRGTIWSIREGVSHRSVG